MTLKFIMVQLLSIIAWALLIYSYYRENKKEILFYQIVAALLYSLHYYFLGAYSGLYICVFEIVRGYLYFVTDDEKDKYIFLCSLPVYGVLVGYMYKNIYDLFPIISCMLAGWSLTKKRNVIIFCAVIEYTLWVIYDIKVKSYSGIFTDGTVALANLILLFDKRIFKDDKKLSSLFNK